MGRQSRVRAVGLVKLLVCLHIEITHNTTNNFHYLLNAFTLATKARQDPAARIFYLDILSCILAP